MSSAKISYSSNFKSSEKRQQAMVGKIVVDIFQWCWPNMERWNHNFDEWLNAIKCQKRMHSSFLLGSV